MKDVLMGIVGMWVIALVGAALVGLVALTLWLGETVHLLAGIAFGLTWFGALIGATAK